MDGMEAGAVGNEAKSMQLMERGLGLAKLIDDDGQVRGSQNSPIIA